MNVGEKDYLLGRLAETHSAFRGILKGVDLEMRVYTDTDWRVRDILGHITTWDREVTKSLRAYLAGAEYSIPGLDGEETNFNEQAVNEQRGLSSQQIVTEWEQARVDFKDTLNEIPLNKYPGDLLYPWGDERGNINKLVEFMIEHDLQHKDEIGKAIQAADKG